MTRRRPTIADVAAKAGVSAGTVSHVLNGTALVRPATRARVEEAIRELGYRRSVVAPSLLSSGQAGAQRRPNLPLLLSVGYISVDYTARVAVLPHRDDRITAGSIDKSLGGPAANVAVAAAALGAPFEVEVELATAVGEDPDSDWALAELARRRVRALPVRRPANDRLSRCFILLEPNGSRTIINEPLELQEADLPVDIDEPVRANQAPRCVHFEGYQIQRMRSWLPGLAAAGWRTSLQATGLPAALGSKAVFREFLSELDLILLNRDVARDVTGCRAGQAVLIDAVGALIEVPGRRSDVVLTLGESGAMVFPAGTRRPVAVPAPSVEVVDTTGAGDAFAGAFLAVWLSTGDAVEAARHGCVAGSLCITANGAQERTVSAAEAAAILAGLPPSMALPEPAA
jgi:sugar/nucleoside kinase (ribokinase family)